MEKEGLDIYVDGDFVRAKDTTLGGDNGISVAMAMAILEDKTLSHPRVEAVFTVDEDTLTLDMPAEEKEDAEGMEALLDILPLRFERQ